jgi:hypothetical protein
MAPRKVIVCPSRPIPMRQPDIDPNPRAWRNLHELALKRDVDLIVVWRLDRAFRSVVDGATTLQTLRSSGCGIRSLQEPWIDTTTPIGEAMYHITIGWAQLEKRQLTERGEGGHGASTGRGQEPRATTSHATGDRAPGMAEGPSGPRRRAHQPGRRRPALTTTPRPTSSATRLWVYRPSRPGLRLIA